MKKRNQVFALLVLGVFAFALFSGFASADSTGSCNLQAKLLNQNPYPATPGDYVKVVFQLTGIQDPSCGTVTFQLLPQYPFSLNPNESSTVQVQSGTFVNNYNSNYQIPYTLRVDNKAINGANTIKVQYKSGEGAFIVKDFNITVNNTETDFEVYVKDYNPSTNELTLDILNSGKSSVDALTVEIPRDQSLNVMGGNVNVLGSLDGSDDTTTTFTATASKATDVNVNILYTDTNGVRREVNKTFSFNPSYFQSAETSGGFSIWWIVIIIIIILIVIWLWRRNVKKKRRKAKFS